MGNSAKAILSHGVCVFVCLSVCLSVPVCRCVCPSVPVCTCVCVDLSGLYNCVCMLSVYSNMYYIYILQYLTTMLLQR